MDTNRQIANNRLFKETIVFTHHYGGNRFSTKRHQDFVNELGFDCVSFDLVSKGFTLRKIWTAQLIEVLDSIEGDKILFSFSSPSLASIDAIASRGRRDVKAWICDGGPFLDTFHCLGKYYEYQTEMSAMIQIIATTIGYVTFGGIGLKRAVSNWMKNFPPNVPVLSIRAGQDKLVPVRAIDAFFKQHGSMNLKTLEIPQAEHLEGLKTFPDIYKPVVKDFFNAHATRNV